VVEGLRLAERLGVRRGPLVEGLLRSSANSWVLQTWDREREIPWADEDMRMVLAAAGRVDLPAPMSRVVQEAIAEVRSSGVLAEGGFGAVGWEQPAYPAGEEAGTG
jgi:3-hydroxyisobutyrate dehydrogenase-like beta-hydroxyacid dehydrogenase